MLAVTARSFIFFYFLRIRTRCVCYEAEINPAVAANVLGEYFISVYAGLFSTYLSALITHAMGGFYMAYLESKSTCWLSQALQACHSLLGAAKELRLPSICSSPCLAVQLACSKTSYVPLNS